jgi:hypothetical protein
VDVLGKLSEEELLAWCLARIKRSEATLLAELEHKVLDSQATV